jgi:hypothetical protein
VVIDNVENLRQVIFRTLDVLVATSARLDHLENDLSTRTVIESSMSMYLSSTQTNVYNVTIYYTILNTM